MECTAHAGGIHGYIGTRKSLAGRNAVTAPIDDLSQRGSRAGKAACDVLVKHEAPDHHEMGFEALTKLAGAMGVKKAYHGHRHRDINYPDGIWFGVGLQGIISSTGDIIVPGAFDE